MLSDEKTGYINFDEYINSGIFVKDNIYFAPALHGKLEFGISADILTKIIEPDCLAVELPHPAKAPFIDAVNRLPYISVLCVESAGPLQYQIVEPQDPAAAAVRRFGTARAPHIHFIDHFCENYREHPENFPDPYSIRVIGYERYCREFYESQKDMAIDRREPEDIAREQYMAASLQSLSKRYKKILFICGLYHYPAIFKMLDYDNAVPFVKNIISKTYIANLSAASHQSVLSESAFLIKHFELLNGTPLPEKKTGPAEAVHEKSAASGNVISFPGIFGAGGPPDAVSGSNADGPGGISRPADEEAELEKTLCDIDKDHRFERLDDIDRELLNLKLMKTAAARYKKNTGSEISRPAFSIMFKFLKNYIRFKGMLSPLLFELVTGARSVADDNYAFEVFDEAVKYPWIEENGRYASIEITLSDLKINGKTITFHRKLKSMRQIFSPYVKMRKREGKKGEWLREWNENQDSVCSHQPEDILIENFGNFLRKKAKSVLTDEQCRIEPFMTSLMDGIDTRETIRNYHIDKKLYVKIGRHVSGKVGSVVFIFDEDPEKPGAAEKYPYCMTWLGEHHQESDMAFYSTVPGEKIVGPGISRCEYGGFMLSYPPLRLYDVWNDDYYFAAKTKPETLLMAAIDYSQEKYIAYCAKTPPRSFFKTLAARVGKKIVYVPMGQFSPQTIKKLQILHILAGKGTRKIAGDYVW